MDSRHKWSGTRIIGCGTRKSKPRLLPSVCNISAGKRGRQCGQGGRTGPAYGELSSDLFGIVGLHLFTLRGSLMAESLEICSRILRNGIWGSLPELCTFQKRSTWRKLQDLVRGNEMHAFVSCPRPVVPGACFDKPGKDDVLNATQAPRYQYTRCHVAQGCDALCSSYHHNLRAEGYQIAVSPVDDAACVGS